MLNLTGTEQKMLPELGPGHRRPREPDVGGGARPRKKRSRSGSRPGSRQGED
jgi:hypothetical protein